MAGWIAASPPFIEGTLKGPDAIFGLIHFYLAQLSAHLAEKIVFVADGARWIWNRVSTLFQSLGIALEKAFELVDFYHAVEHLNKFANLQKGWKAVKKRRWVKKHRRLLFKAGVDKVIEAMDDLCQGRNKKEKATERDYFARNRQRMRYQVLGCRKNKIPQKNKVFNNRVYPPPIFRYPVIVQSCSRYAASLFGSI